jgi:hypothetical protein
MVITLSNKILIFLINQKKFLHQAKHNTVKENCFIFIFLKKKMTYR